MKKIMTLAAMFAAVMMSFSACNPDDTKPQDKPDTEQGGENEDEGNQEEEPTAAITIDGDFADWDALEGAVVATLPEGDVKYEQLKTFKMYADADFIYIFCEFDPENTLVFVPYFDVDHDPSTGNNSKWSGAGYEAKAEGSVFDEAGTEEAPEQGAPHAWDPTFYYYGESTEEVLAAGVAVTSSVPAEYKNGNWAFEASILREVVLEAIRVTDQSKFTMGMIQYNLDWDYIGQLPCKTLSEIEGGATEPMLTVTLP